MNTKTVLLDKLEEWKDFDWGSPAVSESNPIVFKDDPVALAWASYRHYKDGKGRWADLEDMSPTAEDYIKSADIRKYYADRIMMSMLSNTQISEFRKKLYGVVSNSLQLKKNDIGLLHRLPYFYEEDLAIDRVVAQTEGLTQRRETDRITAEFTVIEKVLKSRRSGEYTQFWLRSNNHSAPFMMVVKQDNPYHRLVNAIMSRPVTLSGWAHTKFHNGYHRGLGYFYLADIEVVNDQAETTE